MKRTIAILAIGLIALMFIVGCAQQKPGAKPSTTTVTTGEETPPAEETPSTEEAEEITESEVTVEESEGPQFEENDVDLGEVY